MLRHGLRALASLAAPLALSACVASQQMSPALQSQITQSSGPTGAYAEKRYSEAKGQKTCYVTQLDSPFKDSQQVRENLRLGLPPIAAGISNTMIFVQADGRASISVVEDTYPGSTQYFRIGGRRYSAREDDSVPLNRDAIDSISRAEPFSYTWTDWPYGAEHDDEDAYIGFRAAYEDCLAFLQSE